MGVYLSTFSTSANPGDYIELSVNNLAIYDPEFYIDVYNNGHVDTLYGVYDGNPMFGGTIISYQIPHDRIGEFRFTLYQSSDNTLLDRVYVDVFEPSIDPPIIYEIYTNTNTIVQNITEVTLNVVLLNTGSSSITKYEFYDGENSKTIYTDNTSCSYTFPAPTGSGSRTYSVTVYNEEGLSATESITKTVSAYSAPYFYSFNAYRSDSSGTASSSGTYITYNYKVYSYTSPTVQIWVSENGGNYVLKTTQAATGLSNARLPGSSYSKDNTYSIYAVVIDGNGYSAQSSIKSISGTIVPLNVSKDGTGFAIGKYSSGSNKFECAWDAVFSGTISGPEGFCTASDARLKTNVSDINIDIIDRLRPVQYKLINSSDKKNHYGFIAQDIVKILEDDGVDPSTVGLVGNIFN